MSELFEFFVNLPFQVAKMFSFLTTPLDYINLSPLALFSIGGITILIGIHLIRLFVGG